MANRPPAWPLLLIIVLAAGCSAPSGTTPRTTSTTGSTVEPQVIGEGSYVLGLPDNGPVKVLVGLEFEVPANATHLQVLLTATQGASFGFKASGVAGCDHAYASPLLPDSHPILYTCDTTSGSHLLRFTEDGGNIHFDVSVTALAPQG